MLSNSLTGMDKSAGVIHPRTNNIESTPMSMVKTMCANMWGIIIVPPAVEQLQERSFFHYSEEVLRWYWEIDTGLANFSQTKSTHSGTSKSSTPSVLAVSRRCSSPIISECAGDSHGPSDTRPLTTTVSWSKTGGRPNPRRQIAPEPSNYQPSRGELPRYLPVRRQGAQTGTSGTPSASFPAWKKSRIVDVRHNHLAIFWRWTGKMAAGPRIILGHSCWGQEVSATPDV